MINLKHFYYRGYFDKGIELSQPLKDSDSRKANAKANEKAFRIKNQTLTSTAKVKPFSPAKLEKIGIQSVRMIVQNPGLLPGIGYPHEVGYPGELKLGFGFDHTTGLPVLPGSSVKGVLRSVFPQVKFEAENPQNMTETPNATQRNKAEYFFGLLKKLGVENLDAHEQAPQALIHAVELSIFYGFDFSETPRQKRKPMCEHDVFFDALPVHFAENQLLGRDALTPHGNDLLKDPIPLPFLKVMPGVVFCFCFKLRATEVGNVIITAEQKRRLFAEILCTVGAGAKTNVGYGQFEAENALDRIDRPTGGTTRASAQVASVAPTGTSSQPQPKRRQLDKLRRYDKVVGEVVDVSGNEVHFRLPDVEGFDGIVIEKIPASSLLDRFQVGKRFELTVSDVSPQKKIILAKVSNYTALP